MGHVALLLNQRSSSADFKHLYLLEKYHKGQYVGQMAQMIQQSLTAP